MKKKEIVKIGYQSGLVKTNLENSNLVASVSKFGYWFNINTLKPIIYKSVEKSYNWYHQFSKLLCRIGQISKTKINDNSSILGLRSNLNPFKSMPIDQVYKSMTNQNIYKYFDYNRSIADIIPITNNNLPIIRKIVSTMRKLRPTHNFNKIMFYLTADQIINVEHNPISVKFESNFRKIGAPGTTGLVGLFQPNNPYIDNFKKSLDYLIQEMPNTIDLNQMIEIPYTGGHISINNLLYQPFVNIKSVLFDNLQVQSPIDEHHQQEGGKCNDLSNQCELCLEPLNSYNTIIQHDPTYKPAIVHILSDQDEIQVIDIYLNSDLNSMPDQIEDCFHLECLIHIIQTSSIQPIHPVHGYRLGDDIIQKILDWGIETNLIQKIGHTEYTALVGSSGNSFHYPRIAIKDQDQDQDWGQNLDQNRKPTEVNSIVTETKNKYDNLLELVNEKIYQLYQYRLDHRKSHQNTINSIITNYNLPIDKQITRFSPDLLNDNYNLLDILPECGKNFDIYRELINYFNNHDSNLSKLIFYASIDEVISDNYQFYQFKQDINDPDTFDYLIDIGFDPIVLKHIAAILNFDKKHNNNRLFQKYNSLLGRVNQIVNDNPEAPFNIKQLLPNCMDDPFGLLRGYYNKTMY